MSKELQEKRSKLMADRKALADAASKENRVFTAEEKDKLVAMKTEFDAISYTLGEQEDQGVSIAQMESASRAAMGRSSKAEDDVSKSDWKKYNVGNVFRHLMDGHAPEAIGGFEGEIHRMLQKERKSQRGGIMLPTEIFKPKQAIITTTTGSGGVSTVTSGEYIDALRNRSLIGPLGITILGGLQGKFVMPRSSGFTAYWPGENTNFTISSNAIDAVTFSDKTVGAYQDVTRTMLNQTSLDMEAYLRDGLLNTIGVAISDAVLAGTGGTNTLLGVLNNTNTGMVTASSGAIGTTGATTLSTTGTGTVLTWALALALPKAVQAANGFGGNPAYVTTAAGLYNMAGVAKASNAALFVTDLEGPATGVTAGTPTFASNGLTNGNTNSAYDMVYGLWADSVLGMWGGPEVILDPISLVLSGGKRVVALQSVDFQLRQPQNFARMYALLK